MMDTALSGRLFVKTSFSLLIKGKTRQGLITQRPALPGVLLAEDLSYRMVSDNQGVCVQHDTFVVKQSFCSGCISVAIPV